MQAAGESRLAGAEANARAASWVDLLLSKPLWTAVLALVPLALFVFGLTNVRKDPSVDAFVSSDHQAVAARDFARETFGIEDPVIVVFAEEPGASAFNLELLTALAAFSDDVQAIEGVEPGVMSLATKRAILGDASGDLEAPPIVGTPIDPEEAAALAAQMPIFDGNLVARTGDAFAVVVPVADPNHAEDVVASIRQLAEEAAPSSVSVHLSGVATMNSRLAGQIAADTVVFLPLATLVIGLFLFLALRRLSAIVAPFVVVAGSAIVAVGTIGLMDGRYYLITTALPVVVMAIAVADSIHLTLAYQRQRALLPAGQRRTAMAKAMRETALPIILTSVTTALGFLGLALGSPMRPVAEFGLVAAAGTMAAGALSLTFLPAVQMRMADFAGKPRATRRVDSALRAIAETASRRPGMACGLSLAITVAAFVVATNVRFDYERTNYFSRGDDVLVADELLAERFDGGNVVDVVISASGEGALLDAERTRQVEAIRREMQDLSGIRSVSSYTDQIALMHERLTGAEPSALPEAPHAPAEYMFLYEASGEPEDFDHQLDFDRMHTRLRGYAVTGQFSANEALIADLGALAARASAATGLDVQVSGRLAVNDGWMKSLRASHARTIGAAVLFVFIATIFSLTSFRRGVIATLPVLTGILLLYAAMAAFGIDLAPATSMCAAIAAGLGVDFGIHLVKALQADEAQGPGRISDGYVTVMRACLFSALSLAAGFSVVATSGTPVLRWFGLLIAFSALGSLFGALVLVPALNALLQRRKQRSHA